MHNGIWGFKLSWKGNYNSLCGLPLPYGGKKKNLFKGLRHSFCNHFNGQMPFGQEVVAQFTNFAGLVLCGSDPPRQTNVTLWCTISGYTAILLLYRRGGAQAED